jgi:hypothetical protein
MTSVWTVEDAQAQLPRLIDDAMMVGPQRIIRDGDALVVIVASQDWDEMSAQTPRAADETHPPIGDTMQMIHLRHFICG